MAYLELFHKKDAEPFNHLICAEFMVPPGVHLDVLGSVEKMADPVIWP